MTRMVFSQVDAPRIAQFEAWRQWPVVHGVTTRHGGVSPAPWASLNMSISVGDSRENVSENRARAFQALGRDPHSVADLWQVHGAAVVRADAPRGTRDHLGQADALITDRPRVTLFLRFADCVPILFYDPRRHAIGLAHAGWRGTLKDMAGATVRALQAEYGSDPADIRAAIGPSIGPERYIVGSDVAAEAQRALGSEADQVIIRRNGHLHFDLWAANALFLRRAGVTQIEVAGMCTASRTDDFYSHRGERGQTGRFGALLGLAP